MKKYTNKLVLLFTAIFTVAFNLSFALAEVTTEIVNDKTLWLLKQIRLYSWPICFILLALGFINYYIAGSQKYEKKQVGKSMIIGAFGFLVIAHVLPLFYFFFVGK